jgi:hypothetical protein
MSPYGISGARHFDSGVIALDIAFPDVALTLESGAFRRILDQSIDQDRRMGINILGKVIWQGSLILA